MALPLPLGAIRHGIIQILVRSYAEHAALRQLVGKGNNIEVEEAELALVPAVALGRVECATTVYVCLV